MPFLDRSKKNTPKNGPSSPQNASISNGEGSFVSREAAMTVEVHLPQPVEDSTIVKELITLRSHIEAHTTSFYRKDHVAVSGAELKAHLGECVLKNTAENANGNATALASILLESRSRTTGIRIVIARILFATIDFFGDPQQTLLSPAAISLMAAFRSKEYPDESQEGEANVLILAEP
jgi:hypothetical protein